jgi:hypothetical protein
LASSKGAAEKVIYIVKPILVPVEALEYKSPTKTENQWKIYNQVMNKRKRFVRNSMPRRLGHFSDHKNFHEQILDLREKKLSKRNPEYQDLKQILEGSLVDDVFQERELKRIFEPESVPKP